MIWLKTCSMVCEVLQTIGFTHYYIGKNYHKQSQLQDATYYLKKAQTIFTNINHQIGLELVKVELEQINKQ